MITYKLCPYWISGFADAESSFSLRLSKNSDRKAGWRVLPLFNIELDKRDILLLERIQSFSDLIKVIIPHFHKYPLLKKKERISFYLVEL
jgi:hypothetical protein